MKKKTHGERPILNALDIVEVKNTSLVKIPVLVKVIPEISVYLGMLTREEYNSLEKCDGINSMEEIADLMQKSVNSLEKMFHRFQNKGLVKILTSN